MSLNLRTLDQIIIAHAFLCVVFLAALPFRPEPVEGFESSVAGFVTDYVLSASCGLCLAFVHGKNTLYFAGTFVAYGLGGVVHQFFPNSATDGVGQPLHYALLTVSWGGILVRDLLGGRAAATLGTLAYICMCIAAVTALLQMRWVSSRMDQVDEYEWPPFYHTSFVVASAVLGAADVIAVFKWTRLTFARYCHVAAWVVLGVSPVSYHLVQLGVVGALLLQSRRASH